MKKRKKRSPGKSKKLEQRNAARNSCNFSRATLPFGKTPIIPSLKMARRHGFANFAATANSRAFDAEGEAAGGGAVDLQVVHATISEHVFNYRLEVAVGYVGLCF
jgi:hypothetical protein